MKSRAAGVPPVLRVMLCFPESEGAGMKAHECGADWEIAVGGGLTYAAVVAGRSSPVLGIEGGKSPSGKGRE